MMRPTIEYVRSRLTYDPLSGALTWNHSPDQSDYWNRRYAGTIAGSDNGNGKIRVTLDGVRYVAHVLIWVIVNGEWPDHEIDHHDTDGANNRLVNLRPATHAQNMANASLRQDSSTGLKGVQWRKNRSKWTAQIRVDDDLIRLGTFNCPAAAHFAYLVAADKAWGEYARAR